MKRFTLLLVLILLSLSVYVLVRCNQSKDKNVAATAQPNKPTTGSFVRPPIPEADVPYSHYTINAESGGTIEHPTGSTIVFPANAFVDANGKIITGKVDVRYREFPDPAAMIVSGIPMQYDSAGISYQFESSGMCDIRADQNGKGLFVNPKSQPRINMVSANADESFNLYLLDTTTGKWLPKGKPVVFVPQQTNVEVVSPKAVVVESPIIKPEKPKGNMPIVQVLIDKSSFKELGIYDNMKFQVDETETTFKPQDSDVEWEDVSLAKTSQIGHYRILFKKGSRYANYGVHPVFEGEDYNRALRKFQKMVSLQNANEAKRKNMLAKNKADYEAVEKKNAAIVRENKIIAAQNAIVEEKNRKAIEEKNKVEEENKEIRAENEFNKKYASFNNSFVAENFGFWNCDRGQPLQSFDELVTEYIDEKKQKISPELIFMVYRDINTCISSSVVDTIKISKKGEQMLFAIVDNGIGFISADNFESALQHQQNNKISIQLTIVKKDNVKDYKAFIRSKMKWKTKSALQNALEDILSVDAIPFNDNRLARLANMQ